MRHIKKAMLLFVPLFSFSQNLGVAPFDPEYENYMHSIYNTYHSQQLSREKWDSLTLNRDVHTYSVQKGDNLWDISSMLFGDPNYWPKLWSINANITNPHQITPKHQISVLMGSAAQAPLAVIQEGAGGLSLEEGKAPDPDQQQGPQSFQESESVQDKKKQALSSTENCVQDYSLIAHRKGTVNIYDHKNKCMTQKQKINQRKAVDIRDLKSYFYRTKEKAPRSAVVPPQSVEVPASFPPISLLYKTAGETLNFSAGDKKSSGYVLSHYIVDRKNLEIVGSIKHIEGHLVVVTSEIILDLNIPVDSGDRLTLVRPLKRVSGLKRYGFSGHEVKIQAVVEIDRPVPNQSGLYFAKIVFMYDSLSKEALVLQGMPGIFDIAGKDTYQYGSQTAEIIGTPQDQSSNTITIHSFIYLDKGSDDNVRVGDILSIQGHSSLSHAVHASSYDKLLARPTGRVVVVHTSPSYSTAFVTHLTSMSFVGDQVVPFAGSVVQYEDEAKDDIYTKPTDESQDFSDDEDFFEDGEELDRPDESLEETDSDEEGDGFDEEFEDGESLEPAENQEEKFEEEALLEDSSGEGGFDEEDEESLEPAGNQEEKFEEEADLKDSDEEEGGLEPSSGEEGDGFFEEEDELLE